MPEAVLKDEQWEQIKQEWCNGATIAQLATKYGCTISSIKSRSARNSWGKSINRASDKVVKRSAQIAVRKEVARIVPTLRGKVTKAVDDCVKASTELAEEFMQQARQRILSAENREVAGIASLGKTGVDIMRASLGMDATGANQAITAININFVARGTGPKQLAETVIDVEAHATGATSATEVVAG